MSDANETKSALKEFQNLNLNIRLLTQAFENYVEKMDGKTDDHQMRLGKVENLQMEHHDSIVLLEIKESNRTDKEKDFKKFMWGIGATLFVLVIEKGVELLLHFKGK